MCEVSTEHSAPSRQQIQQWICGLGAKDYKQREDVTDKLRIDERSFIFGKAHQVIFLSSKGKIEGLLHVGTKEEGQPGHKQEDSPVDPPKK